MKKSVVVGLVALLLSSSSSTFASGFSSTDDKWVTKKDEYFTHSYHEGTVNEATQRSANSLYPYISDVESKANAGIAGVSALAGLPLPQHKNIAVGVGVGAFDDGHALAVGFSGNPEGTDVYMKAGLSFTSENQTVMSAGVAYGW